MEDWRPIQDFDPYLISDQGRVLNEATGRIMALSENQKSIVIVGLIRNRVQYKRTVSRLVAVTHLPPPKFETFDSIINLDGDRRNNWAINLEWRPRWFAVKYHAQFPGGGNRRTAIADVETGETYSSVWDAAIKNGLLAHEVFFALHSGEPVWPTRQRFKEL